MSDLSDRLDRLGLSQYVDTFIAEGFDRWDIVLDITESDLTAMNVKLGHRRKLQRAIAEWRGQSNEAPLPNARRTGSKDESYRTGDSDDEMALQPGEPGAAAPASGSTKRKYRRHPKKDPHAPERPKSAYVLFSNQLRDSLKRDELNFVDIAKTVGQRWQVLSPASRDACEKEAAAAKEKYYQELADYKKTPQWAEYQAYLQDFKAKHPPQAGGGEGKRSKLETEASISSGSGERLDLAAGGRADSTASAPFARHHRTVSTDGYEHGNRPPLSVSPSAHTFSTLDSPHASEGPTPMATSPPPFAVQLREPGLAATSTAQDLRLRPSHNPSPPGVTLPPPLTSSPTAFAYQSHPRRTPQKPHPELNRADSSVPSVPSLVHTDTTGSSASAGGSVSRASSYTGSHLATLPPIDATKSHLILPPPVSSALVHSPLEAPSPVLLPRGGLPPTTSSSAPKDARAPWSALLMAADQASNADRGPGPDDKPP